MKKQYEIPPLEIHLFKAIPFGAGLDNLFLEIEGTVYPPTSLTFTDTLAPSFSVLPHSPQLCEL